MSGASGLIAKEFSPRAAAAYGSTDGRKLGGGGNALEATLRTMQRPHAQFVARLILPAPVSRAAFQQRQNDGTGGPEQLSIVTKLGPPWCGADGERREEGEVAVLRVCDGAGA